MDGSLIGYHQLSPEQIVSINKIKQLESEMLDLIESLVKSGADSRLSAISRTHIEIGCMCINKAVARP